MNAIELQLVNQTSWVVNTHGYTTIHNGFGWIVFHHANRTWLGCFTPAFVEKTREIQGTTGANAFVCFTNSNGCVRDTRFKVPATDDFLVEVLKSAHLDIFKAFEGSSYDAWKQVNIPSEGQ
jgi:hypothetical protein